MRNLLLRATYQLGFSFSVLAVSVTIHAADAPQNQSGVQSAAQPATKNAAPTETSQRAVSPTGLPHSLLLVPAPPVSGSAAMAYDEEVNRSALTMHGTPRWELATSDAVLTFPALAQTFACALNVPVNDERTPKLIALMRRTIPDAGRAVYDAKQRYQRTRPFAVNGKPICTPDREDALRRDGSYPSGHASLGWALGLVLTQVSPDQGDALIARGFEFGQSRLVCNVHWPSDVQAGRIVGTAVVARLNADASFRDSVAAARAEVDALRVSGASVDKNCEAEAQALQSWK